MDDYGELIAGDVLDAVAWYEQLGAVSEAAQRDREYVVTVASVGPYFIAVGGWKDVYHIMNVVRRLYGSARLEHVTADWLYALKSRCGWGTSTSEYLEAIRSGELPAEKVYKRDEYYDLDEDDLDEDEDRPF